MAFKYFWSEGVVVESGLVEGGGVGIAKLRHEIWQNGAIMSRVCDKVLFLRLGKKELNLWEIVYIGQ